MPISSRTPEGDPNTCPLCGKQVRIDPSQTPTRDAPCPHCGHLLWFAGEVDRGLTGRMRSPSFEALLLSVGEARFGAIPAYLHDRLVDVLDLLTRQQRLPERTGVLAMAVRAKGWNEVVCELEDMATGGLTDSWIVTCRNVLKGLPKRILSGVRELLPQ